MMETVKEKPMKLYAVRDKATGKLVSNITNPSRKYWDREGNCKKAISGAKWSGSDRGRDLEMVEFTLVENYDERQISSAQQEWVSVDERKPEEDENIMPYKDGRLFFVSVLAYGKERGVRIVNRLRVDKVGIPYLDKDATDGWEWSLGCEDITHWMPLPECPKGE